MFKLDDHVSHKLSGTVGKVVAYGHQIVDGAYQTTIRVKVPHSFSTDKSMFVEDLVSLWERVEHTLKSTV